MSDIATAHSLRTEHLVDPVGLTVVRPRFSWKLPTNTTHQRAYQIVTSNGWDSGVVESTQQLFVPYEGSPLFSREQVEWKVCLYTDDGSLGWSNPAFFEMGLLDELDWGDASWVGPYEPTPAPAGERPAWVIGTRFIVDAPVSRATMYVSAQGVYEAFIDEVRVGDLELLPGWTNYHDHIQFQTFDITDALSVGDHAIDVLVSDGWFRGQVGFVRTTNAYGSHVAVMAKIVVEYADGTLGLASTDGSWTFRLSGLAQADLLAGERRDMTRALLGDRSTDELVRLMPRAETRPKLVGPVSPPVRRVEELRPVSVVSLRPGHHLIDLGQNINGWVRLANLGPAGTTITLEYGEALDVANGDLTTEHLRPTDLLTGGLGSAGQTDHVIASGAPGEVFEPRHSTKGFRYVRISGHPGELAADDVTGVVVHSDLERRGTFVCSDDRVNRLHEAAVWSLRGNMCDIPTDCPQRERVGWTGDWQLFVPTAAFLYDVGGFSAKWLHDLSADQRADGAVPWFVPNPVPNESLGGLTPFGSAGWGDAAVIVPWEVYLATGDIGVLESQYDSAKAWVDYAVTQAGERRRRVRAEARPHALPHEQYLWDAGFHFGEWLEPGEWNNNPIGKAMRTDPGPTATAYLSRSAHLLSEMAILLGRPDDAGTYARVSEAAKMAWQKEFVGEDGLVTPLSQANLVRGLSFGLIPEKHVDRCVADLVTLIREAGTHLGTGFLATPLLLPVLADHGHLDLAFELLYQNTSPSWMTMLERGATTVWEDWDGIDDAGTPSASLNHYSKGAVISFLHRYVAGIQLDLTKPAYRRFRVVPRVGGGLTSVQATHECPYGLISVSWTLASSEDFQLQVTVPPGTHAEVVLPTGESAEVGPGTHQFVAVLERSSF